MGQSVGAVAAQHDGTLIAVGNPIDPDDDPLQVTRISADGWRDMDYGVDGRFMIERDIKLNAIDVDIDHDGRALFSASTSPSPWPGSENVLMRLLPDGSLDPWFGGGGFVREAGHIALKDDRIAVANIELVTLLTSDGVPVDTFGMGGTVDFAEYGMDAHIQDPGRVVLFLGLANSGSFIVRLDANGVFDPSFGDEGYLWTDAWIMALDAAGRILVVGDSCQMGHCTSYVQRFTPDGHLDTSFADGSTFTGDPGEDLDWLIEVLPDGRILLVGQDMTRLLPTGERDLDFGEQGKVTGYIEGYNLDTAVTSDGRIYLNIGFPQAAGAPFMESALYCIEPDGR